jgi:hypothetical protein
MAHVQTTFLGQQHKLAKRAEKPSPPAIIHQRLLLIQLSISVRALSLW